MEILIYIAGLFVGLAFVLFWNALLVWALCWGLNTLGIFAIGPFVVQFSWPLVIVFTVVLTIIKSTFNITIKKRDY